MPRAMHIKPITSAELSAVFGADKAAAIRIITTLSRRPEAVVRAAELLAEAQVESVMVGILVLGRLTHLGAIAHPYAGVYQALGTVSDRLSSRLAG